MRIMKFLDDSNGLHTYTYVYPTSNYFQRRNELRWLLERCKTHPNMEYCPRKYDAPNEHRFIVYSKGHLRFDSFFWKNTHKPVYNPEWCRRPVERFAPRPYVEQYKS